MMIKKGYNGLQILPLIFTSVDPEYDRMGEVELSNSYLIQQMLQSHTGKETIPANNLKMHKFCYNFILNSAAAAMLTFKYARASGQQQAM